MITNFIKLINIIMLNLKDNEPQNQNSNTQIFEIGSQIKNGNLYNVLENLRKNSEILYSSDRKSITILRRKKEMEEKKKFYKDVEQDVIKPGDAVLRIFSESKPINIGDRFLDIKQKTKLLLSDRAYTKKPNIVSGTYRKRLKTETQQQKGDWISRKYSEFDRVVTEQSGALRMLIKNRNAAESSQITKKPICIGKIKSNHNQLFSVFQSSNNDFYQSVSLKQTLSTNAFSSKRKTQNSMQGSISIKQLPSIRKNANRKVNIFSGNTSNTRRVSTDFA